MTRKLFHLGLLGVVLVAGVASYAVRANLGPVGCQPLESARQWLTLSRQQCRDIRREDPRFQTEAQALSQSLHLARQAMANMIAQVKTPDQALRDQAQVVLDAHHALMRRTVRHLMVMRGFADVSQCARLNALCSNVMCPGPGRGMGRGMQGQGMGLGPGRRGQGMMGGMGMGRLGIGRAQGSLAPALILTDAQQKTIAEIDPNYAADSADLTRQVRTAHLSLAETLRDANSPDASVGQALEHFITARTALEQHTVDYVLTLRPLLNPDQQQRLIGLSQRGCCLQRGH